MNRFFLPVGILLRPGGPDVVMGENAGAPLAIFLRVGFLNFSFLSR